MLIAKNILDSTGNTPMVKLNKITAKLNCELVAKCEFLNPSGSIKDRITHSMILKKLQSGELHVGQTVYIPTSGNTGIGAAMVGAVLGLKITIVMPKKCFGEKSRVMKAFGAQLVETPDDVNYDSPLSNMSVAARLHQENEGSALVDQYSDPINVQTHMEYTAQEILSQCDSKIDMLVCGVGTGGTLTGLSKAIKKKCPSCLIVGADPEGSNMADSSEPIGPYFVEGIGYDFIPDVFDVGMVDFFVKTNDADSFAMARRLHREEGILCGASSGAAVSAALKAAEGLSPEQRCVVVLPDTARNYVTKFMDEKWLSINGFGEKVPNSFPPHIKTVGDMFIGNRTVLCQDTVCQNAYNLSIENGERFYAVGNSDGKILGVVTQKGLRDFKTSLLTLKDANLIISTFDEVEMTDKIIVAAQKMEKEDVIVVFSKYHFFEKDEKKSVKTFVGVIETKNLWNATEAV